ncbi:MAG: VCBS repeat-containing protein, partial [Bacteroidota bacterium]
VQKGLFSNLSKTVSPLFSHQENGFIDFKTQPLLHKMNSRIGPGIAVADINNDNKSDFFIGGASGQDGILFVQQENFSFQKVLLDIESTKKEDTGCLFFDANNDGAKDLYVASGGVMFGSEGDLATMYQDRLYINDGKGNFYLDESALPEMNGSASCVVGSDYDRDGDIDLFIGGKMLPKQYPFPGKSYLLSNEGGKFQDISEKVEGLQDIGMVSSAIWTDFNYDNWTDLIIVGEWMPVTFFKNEKGKLINITREIGLASHTGWWNSINAGDFDADGDMDYVVGNLGLNSILKANNKEPVEVYAKDFDNSGNIDPVIFSYIKGESYPMPMRDALIDQINGMKGRFKAYRTYANATKEMVFTEKEMKGALHLQATTFATAYIENLGNNQFSLKPLPNPAQVTPVYGMQIADFTNDGFLDILLAGNNSNVETLYGYYDASEGMLFKGDGKGNFLVVTALEHGLKISGNTKGIAAISDSKGNQFLLCAKNNSDLQVAVSPPNSIKKIRLNADDLYAEIAFKGAKREQKMEFYYGSGYLSQNERCMLINENMESVVIYSVGGKSRKVFDASSIQ